MNQKPIPKYLEVKNGIIQKIKNGEFEKGKLIPSERELIILFGVSRITVRKALAELENDDYLYRVQGKGSFVKTDDNKQNLFALTSCTQDIIKLGMTPSRKVISSTICSPEKVVTEKLNLNAGEQVFSLARVYYADDDPINYTSTFIPCKFVEGIERYDFSKASLYDVIENKYEIRISKSIRTVQAVIAKDKTCKLLSVEKGVPLLLFNCITYGYVKNKEVPIETFKCFYRSDKFQFYINQVR